MAMRDLWPRKALASLQRPRKSNRPPQTQTDLVVRNLPAGATAADVREAFAPFCNVLDVKVEAGKSRGAACVTVDLTVNKNDAKDAQQAIDGSVLRGRRLAVVVASNFIKAPLQKTIASKKAAVEASIGLKLTEAAAGVLLLFQHRGGDFTHVNLALALHRLGAFYRSLRQNVFKGLKSSWFETEVQPDQKKDSKN
jgi:short subunit dehydrogenase-like uncharacterized protein